MRPQTTTWLDSSPPAPLDDGRVATWYISRLVCLPAVSAEARCDSLRAAAVRAGQPAGAWDLRFPGGRLVLHGRGHVVGGGPLDPYRRWHGQLVADRGRRPVAVEVQLSGWSSTRCELGMRPATRSGQVNGRRQRLFFGLGNAALDVMVPAIDGQAWRGPARLIEVDGIPA